jgi:ABC-type branched-subunit amino acid transport system substrate-binding protein
LAGLKVVANIAVPPTATDMTSYVGQAVDSKADSFATIMPPAAQLSIFKGLREQGIDFQNSHVASSLLTANPTFLRDLGAENANGLLLSAWAWSPTDTSKPFIKQYLAELKAAGQKSGPFDVTMLGVTTWASVHVLADALKAKNLDPTPANVAKAFNSEVVPGLTEKYGLAPIDFTKPAFPDNPALSKLRLFSSRESNWKVNSEGVPEPLSQEWVDVLEKPSASG